jgi:uncharacterized RDD family membrane protein YckC
MGRARNTKVMYGSFFARFRALVLDAVVLVGTTMLILFTADLAGATRIAFVSCATLLILYEPVMVARTGATLGHRWSNLRVVAEHSGDNPGFMRALVRFFVKSILGLPSFLFMALTKRHQALHDRVAGTTVRIRDPNRARPIDVVWERSVAELEPAGMPSRGRRLGVIAAYLMGSFIAMSIVSLTLASDACLTTDQCTPSEDFRLEMVALVWLALGAGLVIGGWRARLWGARLPRGRSAASTAAYPNERERV